MPSMLLKMKLFEENETGNCINLDHVTEKYQMIDDEINESVSEPQNVNSNLGDNSNNAHGNDKIFFDVLVSIVAESVQYV